MTDTAESGGQSVEVAEERRISAPLVIFGVAFAVRAIYLMQSLSSPYFGAPFLDEQYFFEWATRISQGELTYPTAFFRAPLYAYLLGGFFAVLGPNFFLPKILQHLLGSVAAVLVFKVADRVFDRPTAWVAGLMAALYPPMIFFEGEILDISLQCFFYPALLLVGLRSLRDPAWKWTILFGIVAGLGAISRPNILLMVVFWLGLQMLLRCRWGGLWQAAARGAVTVGLIVLCAIPLLIHNIRVDGSWVPISTYAGVNLYIGNRLTADGFTASTPRRYESFGRYVDSVELFAKCKAEAIEKRTLNGSEIQRFWLKRAWWEFIEAWPFRFAGLMTKKCVLFWNGYEIRNNKDLYFALQFTPALDILHRVWNFRILAPLGLLGIAIALLRRRSAGAAWLLLGVAAHMISVVLFFVCDRYRLPVTPILMPFAAFAATSIWGWVRARNSHALVCSIGGLVVFGAFSNIPWYDMSPAVEHKDIWNVANCLKKKGQIGEALKHYEEFVALNPDFMDGWNNLGETYVQLAFRGETPDLGLVKKARDCFEMAERCDQKKHMSMALNNLGYCHLKLGNLKAALEAYDEALGRAPDNRLARTGRAEALASLDRRDEALAELDVLLKTDSNYVPALLTKASILVRQNRADEARPFLNRALKLAPQGAAAEIRADPALSALANSGNASN